MTKENFLEQLRKELKLNNVSDIDEIIADYEEHFEFKAEEGKTEEEIVKKLASPEIIAREYAETPKQINKFERGAKITGVTALSVVFALIYAFMWGSVAVLGAFALVGLTTGFCLITTLNIAGLIPFMPYLPSFIIGIACLGLSVISAIGCIYLALYVKQWGKAYFRWCKNTVNGNAYPSVSMQPKLSKRAAFILKLTAMIGLVVFVSFFVIGYATMCVSAGGMEPWHIWNWFV